MSLGFLRPCYHREIQDGAHNPQNSKFQYKQFPTHTTQTLLKFKLFLT